jgi:hypothetical protein
MKNKSALFVLPPLLFISCNLHDTSYLQAGDANGGGGRAGSDAGGSGAAGASAGTDNGIGGAGDGGGGDGGGGDGGAAAGASGEGGDPSMAGSPIGGSSLGGAGASGPCDGGQIQCKSSDVITDFESNDGHLCVESSGTVIAYGDGTGTQFPEVGDVHAYDASDDCGRGSAYALHALGAGATGYGFGVALRFPQNVNPIEAGYKGIKFKAKVPKGSKIVLKVALPTTLDASFGGSCEPTTAPEKLCNDHPAAAVVIATGGWLDYQVPFSSLKQEGWGVSAPLNFEAIAQIHFVFPGLVSGGSKDFDVWLDDVEFYK